MYVHVRGRLRRVLVAGPRKIRLYNYVVASDRGRGAKRAQGNGAKFNQTGNGVKICVITEREGAVGKAAREKPANFPTTGGCSPPRDTRNAYREFKFYWIEISEKNGGKHAPFPG